MEKKIAKLKLMPIFEGTAILEENGSKIQAISIGACIEIRKADGASALFIDSVVTEPVRYKKIEEKDLEIETLQNELAGIVGQFDGQVHKLMAKYGYEWVNPDEASEPAPTSTLESVNEGAGDPVGDVVDGYLITGAISLSKLVDAAAEGFAGEQEEENKFRSKVMTILQDNNNSEIVDYISEGNDLAVAMEKWLDDHMDELEEFRDNL